MRVLSVFVLLVGIIISLSAQDAGFVRLPESDAKKLIVTKVDPAYPEMAKKMNLSGRVVVDIYIDEAGAVEKVQPVNGNALLSGAAVNAVKKWKFTPYPNSAPKKLVTTMGFNFTL